MNWQSAVERTVTGLGYDLVDSERSAGGLLRVFIDRAVGHQAQDGGDAFITVDDCEKVTRQLQHVLEVEGCAYERLEVSSPGLDRPLKKPADFVRFAGQQIELTLKLAFKGRKKYRGTLEPQTDGAGWRVVFNDGNAVSALDFALEELREARLVPVLDFKGRRFSKADVPGEAGSAEAAPKGDEVEGGRIR